MKWQVTVLIVTWLQSCQNVRVLHSVGLSEEAGVPPGVLNAQEYLESSELVSTETSRDQDNEPDPPDPLYPVQHAGLPHGLTAEPLPLQASDHELMFNVSWLPPFGPPARDYSLEVHSDTDTADCRMTMCYEYDIPGSATSWSIPARASPVTETCAVRPGCAYRVRLIAHPWDGHTAATVRTQLAECVAGVCSCAHSPRLPAPLVSARIVTMGGDMLVNVTWTLPPPTHPQRLPKELQKKSYFVSIGQQMVSDAHPSPWFAHTITRHVPTDGLVATGDEPRFFLLPTVEKAREKKVLDVRLLARVSVVDERGCMGPAGNATAFDPAKASRVSITTYVLWACLGGALALGAAGALACGTRVAKVVLRALRPSPVLPREPRRAWFPLPLPSIMLALQPALVYHWDGTIKSYCQHKQ